MHTYQYNNSRIRDRVKSRLMDCRDDEVLRANRDKMEQLQQASLLCKLFNKQVSITWQDSLGIRQIITALYLVTTRTVVLREGRFIPLQQITSIDLV